MIMSQSSRLRTSIPQPAKRHTVSPFEVPGVGSLDPHIPEFSASTTSEYFAVPGGNFSQTDETKHASRSKQARPSRVVSLTQYSITPQSTPTSPIRARSSPTTRLLHKIRARALRCRLWDVFVFCSFAGAATIFIGALAGVGYAPDHSTATHFTAESHASAPGMFRQSETLLNDAEDKEEHVFFERVSRKEKRNVNDGLARPWSGASPKSRYRMLVVHKPNIKLLSTETPHRRRRRHDFFSGELSSSRPNHSLFHERFSQLIASPENPDTSADEDGDGGAEQRGIVDGEKTGDGGKNCRNSEGS